MKFIQIGNNFLINVSKIDIIYFRSNCINIYIEEDLYHFDAKQEIYNNIIDFIYNDEKKLLRIDTDNPVYMSNKKEQLFARV